MENRATNPTKVYIKENGNQRIHIGDTRMENSDYVLGYSKPKYLRRWWMKTRIFKESYIINSSEIGPVYEFYCPLWAKPLDFIWKLIFGNPKLIKGNELK